MSNDGLSNMNLRFGEEIIIVDEKGEKYEGDYRGLYDPEKGTFVFYNYSSRRKELVILAQVQKVEKA